MKTFARVSLFVMAFGVFGFAQSKPSPLASLEEEFQKAFNNKNAAKVASFYAEDGVLMPPGGALVRGRADIEVAFQKAFDANVGLLNLAPIESQTTGSHGFTAGTYTLSVGNPGAMMTLGVGGGSKVSKHKFLTIYKRVGGDWKIAYDMQNADQ